MKKYIVQITKSKGGCGSPAFSLEFDNIIEARQKFFDEIKKGQGLAKHGLDCDKIIVTVAKKDKPGDFLEYEEIRTCQH